MTDTTIAGIDIGTSKISVLIASVGEQDAQPRVMGVSSIEAKGVRKGQIVDINQVTDALEKAVDAAERMAGSKIQSAYVSVGGPHIESQNSTGVVAVSSPDVEISREDINRVIDAAKAISLSSTREVIEVIPREFIVDGQPGIKNAVGMTGVRLEINTHIITASLTNLRNIERCLSDLGIGINSYVFSGLSSSLATVSETERELGVALVDIGGGKTDICVFVEGALSYSASIPIGARHVTNDIAVGLRVSLESAEKIKTFLTKTDDSRMSRGSGHVHKLTSHKHEHGSSDDFDISSLMLPEGLKTISYKTVTDGIIRPRVEELFSMVLDHIERSGYVTAIPSGLVITGGGASTYGLLESARRVVGLPARIGIPEGVSGLIDEIMHPEYASTVGLLLYAMENKGKVQQQTNFKDFDKILKNFNPGSGVKKIQDLFKNFMP